MDIQNIKFNSVLKVCLHVLQNWFLGYEEFIICIFSHVNTFSLNFFFTMKI